MIHEATEVEMLRGETIYLTSIDGIVTATKAARGTFPQENISRHENCRSRGLESFHSS